MLRRLFCIPAKLSFYSCLQHIKVIGLGYVIVAAAAETHYHIIILIAGGKEYHRSLCFLAKYLAEIHAVTVRQHNVKEDKIRYTLLQLESGGLYRIRTMHGISFIFKE